jgi:TonB family protein
MRALLVDGDATALQAISLALRGAFVVDTVTSKADCLTLLRQNEFRLIVACERTADGSGLELLARVQREWPGVLRVFAAPPSRLAELRHRLEPFRLFQTLSYPLEPAQLKSLLALAQAADQAEVDTADVQHIVLGGESEPAESHHAAPPTYSPRRAAPVAAQTAHDQAVVLTRDFALREGTIAALIGHAGPVVPLATVLAASRALRETPTALLVVDLVALADDPLTFLGEVRSRSPRTMVVAIGRPEDAQRLQGLVARGSVHRFLARPLKPNDLRAALESALRQYSLGDLSLREPAPAPKAFAGDALLSAARVAAAAVSSGERRDRRPLDLRRWLVPGASVAAIGLATVLLFFALRSADETAPVSQPPPLSSNAVAPAVQEQATETLAERAIARLEASLTRDDAVRARDALAELQRIAPEHPRLPFFESLVRRAAPSAETAGPVTAGPVTASPATPRPEVARDLFVELPEEPQPAEAQSPSPATRAVERRTLVQAASFPGRTLEASQRADGVSAQPPQASASVAAPVPVAAPAPAIVEARLLKSTAPEYPQRAAREGIEGFVEVAFVVDPRGRTAEVEAVSSSPRDVFESAAVSAVRRWRYAPRTENGQPVPQRLRARIEFKLED